MDVQLTVIIPVYRVEATLRRCVESVLRQQVEQMEVVLVDDGSPDACPAMCDQLAATDPRIVVLHRTNGGLSAARNTGIAAARGEWVTFVDSDDWVEADTYAPLLRELAQHDDCDIVEYPVQVYEGGRDEHRLDLLPWECEEADDYWLVQRGYEHAYAWNKIYRRRLFDSVKFPEGQVFEDVPTTWQLVGAARCVRTSRQGLYHYMANPQGITLTAGYTALHALLASHVDIFTQLRSRHTMDALMQRYYLHMVDIQVNVFRLGPSELLMPEETLSWSCLTDSRLRWTHRLKAAFIKLFSLKRLCQVLQTIHNLPSSRF